MNIEEKIEADKRLVLPLVDQKEVLGIACDLVDIGSPTGHEKECADYIIGRYKSVGMKVLHQEFHKLFLIYQFQFLESVTVCKL